MCLYLYIYIYIHYTILYNIIQYTDSLGLLIQITMQNSFQFRNRVLWLLRIQENSSNKNAPPVNVPDLLILGKDHFREAISSQTARNAREGMYCLRVSIVSVQKRTILLLLNAPLFHRNSTLDQDLTSHCNKIMTLFQTPHM